MRFRYPFSAIVVVLFSLFIVPVASAHNTVPRVEISRERLHPGEVVDVRGVSFGMDDSVTLSLIGAGVDLTFGEVLANGEGEFIYTAVLPADLVEGTYYFRAVTSHHYVLSPPLTVWGIAFEEGGGQDSRDQADGLLVPMPTIPVAESIAATNQVADTPTGTRPPSSGFGTNILILVGMIFFVAMFLFIAMRRRK